MLVPCGFLHAAVTHSFQKLGQGPHIGHSRDLYMADHPGAMASPAKRCAVIGGGISGLVCGRVLNRLGVDVIVYDTGKHAVGGRCSSKTVKAGGDASPLLFDHSAQFFSVGTPNTEWAQLVLEMERKGVVRQWRGRDGESAVGTLQEGGGYVPNAPHAPPAYIGTEGMRGVAKYLASEQVVQQPVWVSNANLMEDGRWRLWHYKNRLGDFDFLVIAHNGKCAARLMATAGPVTESVTKALTTKFGATVKYQRPQYMQLCSLWVLMAHFPEFPIAAPFEGAFVEGVPELSWVADNTAKLRQAHSPGARSWVLISSRTFGQQNKCPQENVPGEVRDRVSQQLLRAFERALGLESGVLRPSVTAVQLWGAGNPIAVADLPPEQPFIFQNSASVGVCGDWLSGASMEAAANSGAALARHIHSRVTTGGAGGAEWDRGLPTSFKKLASDAIGQFAGRDPPTEAAPSQSPQQTKGPQSENSHHIHHRHAARGRGRGRGTFAGPAKLGGRGPASKA